YMLFFFSSRRRHTRSDRDWSSDVCSSDLAHGVEQDDVGQRRGERGDRIVARVCRPDVLQLLVLVEPVLHQPRERRRVVAVEDARSEERRVGKECRSRWWAWQYKTKMETLC